MSVISGRPAWLTIGSMTVDEDLQRLSHQDLQRLAHQAAFVAEQLQRLARNGQVAPPRAHPTHHGPTGDWSDKGIFMRQVQRAIAELRREQIKITHRVVAERLLRSPRALNYALDWHELPRWPWPPTWA